MQTQNPAWSVTQSHQFEHVMLWLLSSVACWAHEVHSEEHQLQTSPLANQLYTAISQEEGQKKWWTSTISIIIYTVFIFHTFLIFAEYVISLTFNDQKLHFDWFNESCTLRPNAAKNSLLILTLSFWVIGWSTLSCCGNLWSPKPPKRVRDPQELQPISLLCSPAWNTLLTSLVYSWLVQLTRRTSWSCSNHFLTTA